jgi:hypothetical protein
MAEEERNVYDDVGVTENDPGSMSMLGSSEAARFLSQLVYEGVLSIEDAWWVLEKEGSNASAQDAANRVAGEFDISPRRIEVASAGMVKWTQVDPQERGFFEVWGDRNL